MLHPGALQEIGEVEEPSIIKRGKAHFDPNELVEKVRILSYIEIPI
jgi:hypothetical protein